MHRELKGLVSSTLLSLCLTSGITICQVKKHLIPLIIVYNNPYNMLTQKHYFC